MEKVLVAYTTHSGSTTEVAQAIGEELAKNGAVVEIYRLEEVTSLDAYSAVVIGAPMILGWHRAAVKFVKRHQQALSERPVALFFMAMSLTQTGDTRVDQVPVTVDAELAKLPANEGRLSFRERYATVTNYLRPVLRAAPSVEPVSVGFFGGKLEYFRLKLFALLFVMLVIRAQPGDKRNWSLIREWAASLYPLLVGVRAGGT